jgi:hypothetical protein
MFKNLLTSGARIFVSLGALCIVVLLSACNATAQCKPSIEVDGNLTVVDPTDPFGLELPLWMKEGQTLAIGASVNSISVIEFAINGAALEFSQVLSITSSTPVPVPSEKVWKVESVVKQNTPTNYRSVTYSIPGTYTFTVPACAREICIEAWGGGGGGSGNFSGGSLASGAGGGGAGFGAGCYTVTPGHDITVVVGNGGFGGPGGNPGQDGQNGQASSVGSLIIADGGLGATYSNSGGTGGGGSSSNGINVVQGGAGTSGGVNCSTPSGRGGAAGNGGAGGNPVTSGTGQAGAVPGGGGGGAATGDCGGNRTGGVGGAGRIVISW